MFILHIPSMYRKKQAKKNKYSKRFKLPRGKISYLVRKTKAHAKSFEWFNQRLAMFFVELNLKAHKINI